MLVLETMVRLWDTDLASLERNPLAAQASPTPAKLIGTDPHGDADKRRYHHSPRAVFWPAFSRPPGSPPRTRASVVNVFA